MQLNRKVNLGPGQVLVHRPGGGVGGRGVSSERNGTAQQQLDAGYGSAVLRFCGSSGARRAGVCC